jgi:hypothetical protein
MSQLFVSQDAIDCAFNMTFTSPPPEGYFPSSPYPELPSAQIQQPLPDIRTPDSIDITEQTDAGSDLEDFIVPDTPTETTAPKSFRLAAKSVFLTYPKCHLEPDKFVEGVEKFGFSEYYAVREDHKDNTPHYHVLGEWKSKKNIKNARHFDIDGYHPNIQSTRNRLAAWRYIHKTKGRSTHVGGDMAMPGSVKKEMKDGWWTESVNITDKDKFVSRIKAEAPREYILNYNNIRSYLSDCFQPKEEEYKHPDMDGDWRLPREVQDWVQENLLSGTLFATRSRRSGQIHLHLRS